MVVSTFLRGHDLFRALTPKEMDRVSGASATKSFLKGETVYRDDTYASHVFVLLEGEVQLRLPGARGAPGVSVGNLRKGELFGIAPLLGADRYTATAHCLSSVQVLAIEAAPLRDVLKDNAQAGVAVTAAVARSYYSRYMNLLKRLSGVVEQVTREG